MNAETQPAILQQNIALALLFPSPTNPRKRFDSGKLNELARSIKTQGVLQPLLVRKAIKPSTTRRAATWPFPTQSKYTPEEASLAYNIADGKVEMPQEGDASLTYGVKAKLKEIEDAKNIKNAPTAYEVVAGERRFRAATMAGLTDVPCFVRELTDLQVLHAQVIENLQRDDLHPLEEAEGYEILMKEHGATAESLGEEIGKSKAYIYARLKLTALCEEARQAFYSGDLDASTALLIARIPVAKLQIQATKKITAKAEYATCNFRQGDKTMSYRTARDLLQDEYMTELSDKIFPINDATLLPKVGACTDCTKRTGNQPDIFDDVKSADVCTDTVCFAMKRTAQILAIQKKAEAEGCAVIIGKEAKKIMPNNQYSSHPAPKEESGLVRLDQTIPNDSEGRTWEQALGKQAFAGKLIDGKPAVQKTMVENPHNKELIPTVKIEDAIKALRDMGIEVKLTGSGARESSAPSKDEAKLKAKVEQALITRKRLFEALHNKIKSGMQQTPPCVPDGLYLILAQACLEQFTDADEAKMLVELYMPGVKGDVDSLALFESGIKSLSPGELFLLSIDCIMSSELIVNQWNVDRSTPSQMQAIAKELGIDTAKIEAEVAKELKPATKKAAPSVAKKEKTAPTPTPAAQAQTKPAPKKTKAAPAAKATPKATAEKPKRKAAVAA